MHISLRLLLLLPFIIITFSGCHKQDRDLEEYVNSLKIPVVNKTFVPALPTPQTWQAANLRSPFETTQQEMHTGVVNPLQTYPLSMLRFAGTVSSPKGTVAYILTPDNMIFQVMAGDLIGDQNGKVISIQPDQLNIREQTEEAGKPVTEQVVTMQLKEAH